MEKTQCRPCQALVKGLVHILNKEKKDEKKTTF